jgi:predicted metal-dependent hydrolase
MILAPSNSVTYSNPASTRLHTLLKFLPEELINYIIYHETAHNIERKQHENFWNLINKKLPDRNTKENDLLTYWFLIQASHNNPHSQNTA